MDKASLSRNYVGEAKMLHEMRSSDFDEREAHDSNELRAAVHHDYNEAQLADNASGTHLHKPHKKASRQSTSSAPAIQKPKAKKTPAKPRRRLSRARKSVTRSPSPVIVKPGKAHVEEAAHGIGLDILPWLYIGGCAAIASTFVMPLVATAAQ